ncbi:hypothetical protein C2G38_2186998 [Gigaspora rosea]|uniref:Replication origin-binding protein domain-containing protein n=1 Tax=Gigaspora rosea TaxID=44941 RepID=A0A397V579_9GLOM|nr:hypothetical protein C2G38_2186998 [Gigaspora rosea]
MSKQSAQQTRYGGGKTDDYSSDSDNFSDNIFEYRSENCSDYGSDYESDNETNTIETPVPQPPKVEEQMSNTTYSTEQVIPMYSKRQERFDDKFTQKDVMNKIREIVSLPTRDMLNNKGSLEDIHLWDYLLPNYGAKEGISLLDAYTREELADKLVIQVEQGEYKKFSIVDDISEVYGLPGIHECINGQNPLRPVIDIDASKEKMEAENVNTKNVFFNICCSFVRALYRILDCSWEEIIKGLVIMTSSDDSKCSYHLLYTPTLLVDYQELKEFTELVYRLTGEKYGKFIDRGLPGRNFCLRLIGSAKKDRVKRILQFSLDNGWDELNHARVQPPASAGFEVRPRILSVEKINNQKKIIVGHDSLKKYANQVLQKYSDYLGSWNIEEKDSQYFVYFSRKAYLECSKCKRPHDKNQRWYGRAYGNCSFIVKCFQQNKDEGGEIFNDLSIAEKIQQKNNNNASTPSPSKIKGPKFPKPFLEMPSWVKCESPLTATEVYESQYVEPLPKEGDVYVGSLWETGKTYTLEHLTIPDGVNLLVLSTRHTYSSAVTTRLNLKSYTDIDGNINLLDHQRVVCQIESLHRIINKCKCEKKCKCSPIPYDLWLDEIVSIIAQAHTRLAGQSREDLYKLIQEARQIIVMDNDLTDLNIDWIKKTVLADLWKWAKEISSLPPNERKSASLICHLRKDVQGIVHALRTDFPELRIKNYHGVSCTNHKFERAFCLFNSYIETNAGTNQMLFRMRCIKDYVCYIEQRASNFPITEEELFNWLLKAKRESLPTELQNRGYSQIMVDFLKKAGMVVSIINATPKAKDDTVSLTEIVKGSSSAIKAEEISDIANANILNHEMAEHLENKPKKTLEEMYALSRYHIADCYGMSPESLTEEFITDYGKYDHMKWFRNLRKLRDSGTNNETAVEAIICEDYRNDRLTTVTQAEKHRICLELLKLCTPIKDIDDRDRYKADIVKARLESPESIKYLQELVPKMARVFDNTDSSRRAKKSGLKTLRAKLGLLNSALFLTYGIKYKAIDNNRRYYRLVGLFDNESVPKLPPYQTGEGPFYENGEDIRYGYSKLSPDEIENSPNSISQDTQNLFDIC